MLPTLQTNPTRLFDTTVFIDHLRQKNKPAEQLIIEGISGEFPAAFSILTDAELWSGVRTQEEHRKHRILLSRFQRLPFTLTIARRVGVIRRIYKEKGHTVLIPDGIIAATAEHYNLPLYTRNVTHFKFIDSIVVFGY